MISKEEKQKLLNNFCKLKCNMSRFGVKCLICEDYYEFENTLNANYPDDFDFKKEFPDAYITADHINAIKSMTRVQAIKYIKEEGQGFDNLKLAAIYYDTYIKPCL